MVAVLSEEGEVEGFGVGFEGEEGDAEGWEW